MPRLSAPSRRDCSPDSALAARSRRGGFPSLHRCIAAVPAAALALLLLAALAAPAQAAIHVSTIGQTDAGFIVTTARQDVSQGFTTGSSGAILTSIEIRMDTLSGTVTDVPTVTLHKDSATSAAVATLTGPSSIAHAAANYTFTAPADTALDASATYYVMLEGGADDIKLRGRITYSDNEDSGGSTGWSVADGILYRTGSSTGAFTAHSQVLMIRVNGTTRTVTVPGAPQNLVATEGEGLVRLNWSAPATNGGAAITRYEYRHAAGTTVPDVTDWTVVADSNDPGSSTADETSVLVRGLTNAMAYAFEVRAVNSAGDGTKAGPVTATPAAVACDAPNFGTRRNIWTGNLTVERFFDDGTSSIYGFTETNGGLDDKDFTIGSNDYEVDTVVGHTVKGRGSNLNFSLKDSNLTRAERAALRLHVCDARYDFGRAGVRTAHHTYGWVPGLDWSLLSTRTLHLSLPANTAARGKPAISGRGASTGQTLTAVKGTITDVDGVPVDANGVPTTFTYQWVRVDGATETDISGATSRTYTLGADDLGKTLKVKVSFTDALGSEETGSTSDAYPRSGTITAPTVPGAPQNLMASAGDGRVVLTWSAPASDGGSAITEYDYRYAAGTTVPLTTPWTTVADGSDAGMSTADERGVTIGSLTNATAYAFEVRAVNSAGDGAAAGPATATPAAGACAGPNFGTRRNIWTGSLTVGAITVGSATFAYGFAGTTGGLGDKEFTIGSNDYEVDSVSVVAIGDNDGHVQFSLKDTNLTSAERAALRLHVCNAAYDFSAVADLSTEHTYRWVANVDWSGVSSRTLYLSLPANNAATGRPTISGTARGGSKLTARLGTMADADGLQGPFTIQWVRVDGSNETDISGATSGTYTLVAADVRRKVKLKVGFTDALSGKETLTSDAYPASGTIAGPVSVPGEPTSFMATAGDGEVTLSWAAPASGGGAITEYEYRYSTGTTVSATATWTDVPDGTDAGDSTADETGVTISSLNNGTEYAFEVRAVNSAGDGTAAGPVNATPAPPPASLVSNIGQTVSVSSPELGTSQDLSQGFTTATTAGTLDSIEVKFAAANDGTAHPTVTLHSGSPTSTAIATLTAPSGTVAATAANYTYTAPSNTTLTAATTYYVVLEGSDNDLAPQATASDNEDSGGETGWSVANGYGFRTASSVGAFTTSSSALLIRVNGTAKAVTVPGAPTSFMARTGDGEVDLSWSAPASNGGAVITNYRYRYSAGSTVASTTEWTDVPDGSDAGTSADDETGLTISSLTNGTEYAFEVLAENSAGEGAVAGSITATPAVPSCAAPNFGTRRDIWTGTVTLGTFTGGGDTVGYGFGGATGDLDDKTFTIGSTSSYEIDGVQVVVSVGSDDGDILLYLNGNLTAAEKTALKLHVCDAAFDFSAATLDTATHTYTFVADLDWSGLSTRTLYLSLPANNAATGKPTITGPGTDPNKVGSTLTAAKGDIADTDGVPATLSYQWVRVDGSDETDIDGATSSSYTLALEDTGLKVKVKASFTDNLNSEETRTSDAYPSSATIVGLPAITIAPGQAKATGKYDYVHYTLTRAGATTATQAVTVTLDPPAGNDWNLPDAKLSHAVTFAAGSATATLSIRLRQSGFRSIGFSNSATMGGTLTARIGDVSGFDNRDTAEVEVVVVPDPVWVFSFTETAYSFAEDGGAQTVTVEVRASSPDVPPPIGATNSIAVSIAVLASAGTATSADYAGLSQQKNFSNSQFSDGTDGHQRATAEVTFTPTDDSLVEPHEMLTLQFEPSTGYRLPQIGLQAPDGTVEPVTTRVRVNYPITIKDDDTGLLSMAVTSTPSLMATGSTDADLYGEGNMIEFTATFNNKVTVSGTPEFEFVLGTTNKRAAYVRGSDSTELVFSYTVVAADTDSDGISWAANKIVKVSSATIREMGETTDAVITHVLQGTDSGHKVDGSQAGVDRPAVSIAAVHDTAAPFIAHPEFKVTIAEAQTAAVTVNLTIAQGEDYLAAATQTIEIPANMTSATKKFASTYTGTTGGTLTATVAAGTGYMPADAPANAASVNMVAPGKAALLGFEWSAATYSVTEGDGVNVTVTLRTGANVPGPRETISVYDILTGGALTNPADTATPSASGVPGDYTQTSAQGGDFAPGDWVADGSVFRATRSHTIQTVEDTAYEGTERFKITLSNESADDVGAVVSSKSETIVTIVDDDALKVTGVAVSSTPSSGDVYGVGETISFTATFRGPVTVTGTPQLPFSLGGVTKQAAYASGSDSTELVFSYTVAAGDNDADGVSWRADALSLNGGAIKFLTGVAANRVDAALTHAAKTAQSGHKVDTAPVLSTPTVDGTALVLTYNEALDMGSEPGASAFTVKVGGTAVSLASSNPVAVAGRTVTLTLAAAVTASDTVTVSYAAPGSNPLQDAGGTDAPAFSDLAVTNLTTDGPTLTGAVVDGTGLVLTFGDPLNTASAPGSAAFTVKVGGTAVTQASSGPVAIAGSTVTLTLATAVAASDTVTVSYAVPQTNPLRDADDLDAPAFDDRPVTNRTIAVPAAPGSFRVTAGNAQAELSWSAPFDGNSPITKYRYRYAAGTAVPTVTAWTDAPDSNNDGSLADERAVTVTGLTNETEYAFEVQALNSAGEGPAAGARATPVEDPKLPSRVIELRAVVSSNTVELTWAAPARSGSGRIARYEVRYAPGSTVPSGTGWRSAELRRFPGAYVDGLENGRRHAFEVRAVNVWERKGATVRLTATPRAEAAQTLPTAPRGLRAAGSLYSGMALGRVTLNWEAPADLGNTHLVRYEYRYAARGAALSSARWNHGPISERTTIVRNLAVGTSYTFQLRAVTLAGAGAFAAVGVTTPRSTRLNLSVFTRGAAVEGENLTIGVRRSGLPASDEGVLAVVEIYDSAGARWSVKAVDIAVGARAGTVAFAVPFDGARGAARELAVTLSPGSWDPLGSYIVGTPASATAPVRNRDPLLRVADASVNEGPQAQLQFEVSLDRAAAVTVTVDYATSDDTATAGADYTETSGMLSFAAGETAKTVLVPVLDDAHDEGTETLTLTLSNVQGALLDAATATGRIVNTDPMPAAWLARFGRTGATQVLGLLDARFDEARAPASQLTLGGRPVNLSGLRGAAQGRADPSAGPAPAHTDPAAVPDPGAGRTAASPLTLGGGSQGRADPGAEPAPADADPFDVLAAQYALDAGARGPAARHADPSAVPDPGAEPAAADADPFDVLASRYTLDDTSWGIADLNSGPATRHADPAAAPGAGAVGGGGEATLLERLAWRLLTRGGWSVDRRQFLSGSSFDLSLSALGRETDGAAIETARVRETPGHWSMWGRGALTRFTGQDRGLSLDGDVLTGLLGLDYSRGRWLAGVGLAYNDGNGAYRASDSGATGELDSTLVSVHPYLHYALTERLSAWGTLGYGAGGLSLRPGRDGAPELETLETDIQMRMGALGLRGIVFADATTELALKSDLMWVRTTSSATAGLASVDGADASRVRLLLTGRHRHALATGAELTPNVELGLRYDDGDAETGAGIELGGGLRYADPVRGLTVEATARALLAHEAGGYEEWGLSGSLQLDPGRLGRGLSLRLASGWGLTDSSTETLWQQQTASGLAQGPGQTSRGRIRAEWAYGLDVPRTRGLLTPYGSVEMAGGGGRTLALGWRFELGQSLSLSLAGERRETALARPEHGLMLQTALPW